MNVTKIEDWQFGRLRRKKGWGWCPKKVEWTSGLMIDLCIRTELTESNKIPERARIMFNTIRDRENEFKSRAAMDLLDEFNEMCSKYDKNYMLNGWPFDSQSFINFLSLSWVFIDTDKDSELQYIIGGAITRVIISPDLSFKEAFFDCG